MVGRTILLALADVETIVGKTVGRGAQHAGRTIVESAFETLASVTGRLANRGGRPVRHAALARRAGLGERIALTGSQARYSVHGRAEHADRTAGTGVCIAQGMASEAVVSRAQHAGCTIVGLPGQTRRSITSSHAGRQSSTVHAALLSSATILDEPIAVGQRLAQAGLAHLTDRAMTIVEALPVVAGAIQTMLAHRTIPIRNAASSHALTVRAALTLRAIRVRRASTVQPAAPAHT